jgi:hypothetical protein
MIFILINEWSRLAADNIAQADERPGVWAFFVEAFFLSLCPEPVKRLCCLQGGRGQNENDARNCDDIPHVSTPGAEIVASQEACTKLKPSTSMEAKCLNVEMTTPEIAISGIVAP